MANNLIKKELTITIDGRNATLSESLYIYQRDRNIDIYLTIVDCKFKFNEYAGNILTESTAKYALIRVLKPNGAKFISDKFTITDNQVVFQITPDFSDQVEEIGVYKLQISLYDGNENENLQGRITIPPIEFSVLEPIFDYDDINEVEVVSVSCRKVDDE